ncbi:hypothetical protein CKM354_000182600 [Cercospora kikuchii]|uniref:BZIP domain-containing protein n=1 Tax=Cercospora kikuchii TaxID=84275 RepID=A0A9P3C6G1_9PEZI|nr:uncharacterized protein CKM354_000182600 [Cercospora kikuchii]GIZ38409.1 hypothetical protein CKM354_000182600 [Cercospora kikuchii]
METMDYSFYSHGPQQYQYMGFGADSGIISSDGLAAATSYDALDASAVALGAYDFDAFDNSMTSAMSPHLPHTGSVSPPQRMSTFPNGSMDSAIALELDQDRSRRNSSEEKENLTPAQSRRKAQNRAAQRAFRERKERHVRDLEAKLNLLTTTTSSLQSDNERLKLLLQRVQTENEILRATASHSPTRHHPPGFVDDPSLLSSSRSSKASRSSDDLRINATRLANGLLSTEPSSPSAQDTPSSETNLLSASATWDLLQSHPLYRLGSVDIGEVCERLKKMARCDGTGPMFDEDEVRKVIEEVGRGGSDDRK